MKVLSIGISSESLVGVIIDGTIEQPEITNLGKLISIPKTDNSVKSILDLKKTFEMKLAEFKPDLVILHEGGNESKKQRVRMEFCVLASCEEMQQKYKTYPSNSTTRYTNSGYETKTGASFDVFYDGLTLPKYLKQVFAAGWKFFDGR